MSKRTDKRLLEKLLGRIKVENVIMDYAKSGRMKIRYDGVLPTKLHNGDIILARKLPSSVAGIEKITLSDGRFNSFNDQACYTYKDSRGINFAFFANNGTVTRFVIHDAAFFLEDGFIVNAIRYGLNFTLNDNEKSPEFIDRVISMPEPKKEDPAFIRSDFFNNEPITYGNRVFEV